MGHVGEFELLMLLAVAQLEEDAYGVTIRDFIEGQTSRNVTLGAIYKTLGRLESKGMVRVSIAPPTGERGGRRKKVYALTTEGRSAAKSTLADLRRLTEGLEPELAFP